MRFSTRAGMALLAGLSFSPVSAQTVSPWSIGKAAGLPAGLRIGGSVRARHETISGQTRAGFNASDNDFSLRTTLLAEYRSGPLTIATELYDSRVYGGNLKTPISTNDVDAFEPVQAYVGYTFPNAFGAKSAATIAAGRFLLNLGSRRIVAADDYRNTINSYTGVRLDTVTGRLRTTAIYVLPQIRRPDDLPSLLDNKSQLDRETFDLQLWGGTMLRQNSFGTTGAELSFFALRERDAPGRPTRDRRLVTVGGRLIREPAKDSWDHEFEAFYQFGHASDGLGPAAPLRPVSAWFAHAELGRSFRDAWRTHLAFDLDIASGDRPGGHNGRFDTLFGSRRAEYAPPGLDAAVGRANIIAPGIRFEAAPSKALDLWATYKPMWLESRSDAFSTSGIRDATGRSGRFAAHQIDLRVRYWLVQDALRLEIDEVYRAKGRFLRDAPNISSARDTEYLSLNATAFF